MRILSILALFAACTMATQSFAADVPKPLSRADVEEIIKDYLIKNPTVLEEALNKLREQKQSEAETKQKEGMKNSHADLFSDTTSPAVGASAKAADVTMVEFFDYHCGYCKHVLPVISQVIKDDPKLRVIFREFPILSEDSTTAAKAALAVYRLNPDKYFAYHSALMAEAGKFDEKRVVEIAGKLGVDTLKLTEEMKKPEIAAMLEKNRKLASELGIRGTPAIILSNNELIPGAVTAEDLKKMIKEARDGKKK